MRQPQQQEKFSFQTQKETEAFFNQLKNQMPQKLLILLEGEMGSGKTQIVSWLTEAAQSPTFAFHHRYQLRNQVFDHFDLDRVQTEDELESVGLWDILHESKGCVMVEWPQRVPFNQWPRDWPLLHIQISKGSTEEARDLVLTRYAALL